ncbi:MAG: MFS transporter [Hyphomicrobiaceae bacterium]|nr:MFS transporter [Hyphomicrobiaceae bacterium]
MSPVPSQQPFFGWRVVAAAFVLAAFGWGLGFYGPPIYLHAVVARTGWSVALVSTAVTVHFLVGVVVIANLPTLYRMFGIGAVTTLGSLLLAVGVVGWAIAGQPWQLFAAALVSGAGWVAMGAAAVNAIIAPWFVRTRPAALAMAYNGASVGGVVFSPLWVALIAAFGFVRAAVLIGAAMGLIIAALSVVVFSKTPQSLGQSADGDATGAPAARITSPDARPLPGMALWRDWRFQTLAVGTALGLFAQIGLIAHLFSLLVPVLGAQTAGIAMGLATASAIVGRTLFGWLMPVEADRRLVVCASYSVQVVGSLVFIAAGETSVPLLMLGVVLFGLGIGNATSLPPLIAQIEFVATDVPRVVPLVVAIGQATYAFAPAAFGLLRSFPPGALPMPMPTQGSTLFFAATAVVQLLAITCFLAGRRRAETDNASR